MMYMCRQFILLVVFFCFSFSINAKTYYVSENGNNNSTGLSWAEAWRTLEFSGRELFPGDTLIIRKGRYPYKYLGLSRSGKENAPITIKGELVGDPPVITGAVIEKKWEQVNRFIWKSKTTAKPILVVEDETPLSKASSMGLIDGSWFWAEDVFYYKPTSGFPEQHVLWRTSMGGGVQIANKSWIVVENISCWLGKGACVLVGMGGNNVIRNVYSKWYVRGIEIRGGAENYVENCYVEENREGIYLLAGSANNKIVNCKAIKNGNYPLWNKGDRAGIAIGDYGINVGNHLIGNEVAYNGGVNSDPGMIVYKAPETVIKNNYIHDNYGSGLFVTINSDGTLVDNNVVSSNGRKGVLEGGKNISGLSVRRSRDVIVENNIIKHNFVAKDTIYKYIDVGPRAGLDLRGNKGDNMFNIVFSNNIVCGTLNGPDVFISDIPNTNGFLGKYVKTVDCR